MASTKRQQIFTSYYRHIPVSFNATTGKYSIEYQDLTGEWDSLPEAQKAIREWKKPSKEKKLDEVTVFFHGYDDNFTEAKTRFSPVKNGWRKAVWVRNVKDGYRHTECLEDLFVDCADTRNRIKQIAALRKEIRKLENRIYAIRHGLKRVKMPEAK